MYLQINQLCISAHQNMSLMDKSEPFHQHSFFLFVWNEKEGPFKQKHNNLYYIVSIYAHCIHNNLDFVTVNNFV